MKGTDPKMPKLLALRGIHSKSTLTILTLTLAFGLATQNLHAQEPRPQEEQAEIGPGNGWLLIIGGGSIDGEIRDEFIRIAGGPDAPIIIIPTASGRKDHDETNSGLQGWAAAGATNLTVLHTTDPDIANTDEFAQPIRDAHAVWFGGGRQWRLADAYLHTKVHDELWALLDRGGIIGGSSAGATIQGSYLARGDSQTNTIMMGDHEEGMGFLKNTAIDQHLLTRNRQFDLLEIIQAKPHLLGIGLDESTAILVHHDTFRVLGRSYVAIYDATVRVEGGPGGDGGPFYLLSPGDTFNLKTRQPYQPSRTEKLVPLERVSRQTQSEAEPTSAASTP